MSPPAVILGTPVVPAEGGTTGVSGIQRNKGNHLGTPAKHQQGLTGEKKITAPPGTRRTMMLPPAIIPAALVPASEGGATPSRRHSRHPSRSRRRRERLGCRESRGTKATTWALPLNIKRG